MLAANEVLVKVACAAVFQGSAKLMELLPHFNSLPWIPEYDFAGVVEAIGADVRDLKPGDAVFGAPNPKALKRDEKHNGVLAEYVVLDAGQVVRKSEKISFEDACGLAGNGCTAVQFCERLGLKLGDRVLVVGLPRNDSISSVDSVAKTGASGGLGSKVTQVVKAKVGKDGVVIATCSAANAEAVRSLGADEVRFSSSQVSSADSLPDHRLQISPRSSSVPCTAVLFDAI
jgi:NADPH:quinone reductase-like Zn-dependent oxidoreductase